MPNLVDDTPLPGTVGAPAPGPARILPQAIQQPTTLRCDAVVIGSGAGGGTAAGVLASAGYDVIVLEKGGHFEGKDLRYTELEAYPMLYERGAMLTNEDTTMAVLAGSCLGGGTTVNWSASLRLPKSVRQEWASKFGCPDVDTDMWDFAVDAVCSRLNVGKEPYAHNPNNAVLGMACQSVGLPVSDIPRNCKGCGDGSNCGWCQFGCAWGHKQNTLQTFLRDAAQHGYVCCACTYDVGAYMMLISIVQLITDTFITHFRSPADDRFLSVPVSLCGPTSIASSSIRYRVPPLESWPPCTMK
jgi:long-chain-alcohol oxidase